MVVHALSGAGGDTAAAEAAHYVLSFVPQAPGVTLPGGCAADRVSSDDTGRVVDAPFVVIRVVIAIGTRVTVARAWLQRGASGGSGGGGCGGGDYGVAVAQVSAARLCARLLHRSVVHTAVHSPRVLAVSLYAVDGRPPVIGALTDSRAVTAAPRGAVFSDGHTG
jgi:hypothetical protein